MIRFKRYDLKTDKSVSIYLQVFVDTETTPCMQEIKRQEQLEVEKIADYKDDVIISAMMEFK